MEQMTRFYAAYADEISFDSSREVKEMMLRTARSLPFGSTNGTLTVLAVSLPAPSPAPGNEYGPAARAAAGPRKSAQLEHEMLLNSRRARSHLFSVPAGIHPRSMHSQGRRNYTPKFLGERQISRLGVQGLSRPATSGMKYLLFRRA
jgi:hypothetical protein